MPTLNITVQPAPVTFILNAPEGYDEDDGYDLEAEVEEAFGYIQISQGVQIASYDVE